MPELPELVDPLIVAHPAPVPAAGLISRGQNALVLAVEAAQPLLDPKLHKRRSLPIIELPKAFRLVSGDPQVLPDIFTAPRGGAV